MVNKSVFYRRKTTSLTDTHNLKFLMFHHRLLQDQINQLLSITLTKFTASGKLCQYLRLTKEYISVIQMEELVSGILISDMMLFHL